MTVTSAIAQAASRRAILDNMVIDHLRQRECLQAIEALRKHGRLVPVGKQCCLTILGPSQSGKTTVLDRLVQHLNTREALEAGMIPALKVTLQANVTRKQLAQNLLSGFEAAGYDALSNCGTEIQLVERVLKYLHFRRVELLILDEFQHFIHSENRKVVMAVSEAFKYILISSPCPIVVAGLPHAQRLFDSNPQLANRAQGRHIHLRPLDPNQVGDVELLRDFLAGYFVQAERLGAGSGLMALLRDDIPACIWEVSQGVLGAVCNLIKEAVFLASLGGRQEVTRDDLTLAADYAVVNRLYHRNPFREGLSTIRPKEFQ